MPPSRKPREESSRSRTPSIPARGATLPGLAPVYLPPSSTGTSVTITAGDPFRGLRGLGERGPVADAIRVEDHEVWRRGPGPGGPGRRRRSRWPRRPWPGAPPPPATVRRVPGRTVRRAGERPVGAAEWTLMSVPAGRRRCRTGELLLQSLDLVGFRHALWHRVRPPPPLPRSEEHLPGGPGPPVRPSPRCWKRSPPS